MTQYLDLLSRILEDGTFKDETRGQPTIYRFHENLRVDLSEGPPIVTTRKVKYKNLIAELLWLISGVGSIDPMVEEGVNFWKPWADKDGNVESYGHFWRRLPATVHKDIESEGETTAGIPTLESGGKPFINVRSEKRDHPFIHESEGWHGFDQLAYVIWMLENNPYSRRIKLDQWVPQNAVASSLPPCPCHIMFDVVPPEEGQEQRLNLQVWQRSADVPVGVVYNLGVYGLFGILLAREVGMEPGEITFSFTNAHVYQDQIPFVLRQLKREPFDPPSLMTNIDTPMLEWEVSDHDQFALVNYNHHEHIPYPVQE